MFKKNTIIKIVLIVSVFISAILFIMNSHKQCSYKDISISFQSNKNEYAVGDSINLKILLMSNRNCVLHFYEDDIYKHILLDREGSSGEVFFKRTNSNSKYKKVELLKGKEIEIQINGVIILQENHIYVKSEMFEKPWMFKKGRNKLYCIFRAQKKDWDTDDIMPSDNIEVNVFLKGKINES